MSYWMLLPPVAFILILVFMFLFSAALQRLAFKPKHKEAGGTRKAYACGEDVNQHRLQVDYGQFFPFAYFFTILHVVALMVTTVPVGTIHSACIAVLYLVGAVTGLIILFRR